MKEVSVSPSSSKLDLEISNVTIFRTIYSRIPSEYFLYYAWFCELLILFQVFHFFECCLSFSIHLFTNLFLHFITKEQLSAASKSVQVWGKRGWVNKIQYSMIILSRFVLEAVFVAFATVTFSVQNLDKLGNERSRRQGVYLFWISGSTHMDGAELYYPSSIRASKCSHIFFLFWK